MISAASSLTRVCALVRRFWAGAASAVLGGATVLCILMAELRLRAGTYSPFSDYWEHAAVLHALIENPWHPSNPHLASPVPSPRFGPISVLNALVARALGLNALQGLSVAAVVFTCTFVMGTWLFFRSYFRDPRAGLYGLLVVLGSWWEAWTFSSVYQPKVLLSVAAYPWLGAFGVTLFGLTSTLRVLRRERPRWWEFAALALWISVVFLTHQLTAMMALSAFGLLALTEPRVLLRRRLAVFAMAILGCALSALWPYFSVWSLLAGGHSDAGWVGQSLQAASHAAFTPPRHRFYVLRDLLPALGLGLATLATLPFFFLRWRRLFVGLGVLSMLGPFAINAFVPLPLGHRFLLLSVFFLQAGVVWLCVVLTPGSAEFPRALERPWFRATSLVIVWAALGTFAYHNVRRTQREWAYFQSFARRGDSPLVRYARSAADVAGKGAVILADPLVSWPVPAFGPKVIALHHENPFVVDAEQRMADVDSFFAARTTDKQRFAVIRRYQVTHVLVKHEPRASARRFLNEHAQRTPLPAGFWLFTLAPSTK